MKLVKRIVSIAVLAGIAFAALYFIPLPRNIDMFLPCVMWDLDDPTTGEAEGIEIKGKYYDYLIREDKFRGSILISEVNLYEEEMNLKMNFFQMPDGKMGSIHYFSRTYNKFLWIGSMYMQGMFDEIFIDLYVDEKSSLNDKIISAPATTIEEAVAIAEAMNFA